MSDSEQFLFVGDPGVIRDLVHAFVEDPKIEIVNVSGPPGALERIVARMPAARADSLRSTLGAAVLVERDEMLGPAQESRFDIKEIT